MTVCGSRWLPCGPEQSLACGPEQSLAHSPEPGSAHSPEQGSVHSPEQGSVHGPEQGSVHSPVRGKVTKRDGAPRRPVPCMLRCVCGGYLMPRRCFSQFHAETSVSSSVRSAFHPSSLFARVGSAQMAMMSPARRGAIL